MERVHSMTDGPSHSIAVPLTTTRSTRTVPEEAGTPTMTRPHHGIWERIQRISVSRRRSRRNSRLGWYRVVQAIFRALGWLTTIASIVIMAYLANRWHDKGGAIAAGIVGAAIALLNDSWQMVAHANNSMGFNPLSPARALLHDIFALAICLGAIVLLIFSSYTFDDAAQAPNGHPGFHSQLSNDDIDGAYSESKMMRASLWSLAAIVIWRSIFTIWGCWDCFVDFRRARRGLRLSSSAGR